MTGAERWDHTKSVVPWVAPFGVFMLLVVMPALPIGQPAESLIRTTVLLLTFWVCSRRLIATLRVKHAAASVLIGLAVFVLWIAPDLLFPTWREHWLLQNSITGSLRTSIDPAQYADPLTVGLRFLRAALLVPILEELFWRGWLPRWLVNPDWSRVPLGTFNALAFIGTAVLFASEHGPYWDVGLVCGLVYNAWMWRSRSLGDLVLTHAVTNASLSIYVLATGRFTYWM